MFLRQGDGFDRDTGIFVSRLEMGSAAETMGMHVGDEVIKVNGVDVSQSEIARVEMLMSVVDIVALTIARVRRRNKACTPLTAVVHRVHSLLFPLLCDIPVLLRVCVYNAVSSRGVGLSNLSFARRAWAFNLEPLSTPNSL